MNAKSVFEKMMCLLKIGIQSFPDFRNGNNKKIDLEDAALCAFSTFFMQSPSFLAHQTQMQAHHGHNNADSLFGIQEIVSHDMIRNLLDPVNPKYVHPTYMRILDWINAENGLDDFRHFDDTLLIPLDGTGFFSSSKIKCDSCSTQKHKSGIITYKHTAITPTIVCPGRSNILPLPQEFITPQDGTVKQDCENAAAKRWITKYSDALSPLRVTLLGDDLYAKQSLCKLTLEHGFNFIFVCKPKSHVYITEWIDAADPKEDLNEFVLKKWTGKERLYSTYRFINKVPIRNTEDALPVNWAELTIRTEDGTITFRNSFITNHEITKDNVTTLIQAGRCRWKIENENNNNLKTKGYHLEHNFGHGKEFLSNLLLSLNILSYLFHNVLGLFDKRYSLLRATLRRRVKFFGDIETLSTYIFFQSWDAMLVFMIKGLRLEDPG